jgi:hypothetical protein
MALRKQDEVGSLRVRRDLVLADAINAREPFELADGEIPNNA